MLFYINIFTFFIGISKAAYLALFNLLLKERGFANNIVGNASFYYSWGVAFGGLFFSALSDKLSRKKVLILTMPLFALIGLLRLETSKVLMLYLLSFAFGFVDTSIILPTISVIEHSDEKKKLKNSNINFAIVMLTGVVGYFGAGLLSEKIGLINSLRISMVIAFFSIIPLFKVPNVRVKREGIVPKVNTVQLTILVYYILSGALVSVAAAIFINFGNVIFFDLFSFSPSVITFVLTISQLSTAIVSVFSHRITSKIPIKFAMFLFYTLVTVLIFIMPATLKSSVLFSIFYVLRFVFLNITTPIFTVFCLSFMPIEYIATLSGLSYFTNNAMRAIAAKLFSLLSMGGETDYKKLFFVTGVFYLLNTVLTLLVFLLVSKFNELNLDKKFTVPFLIGKKGQSLKASREIRIKNLNKSTKSGRLLISVKGKGRKSKNRIGGHMHFRS
ncbi:MAG: MFS transporter [Fervidobacterium sp.]